VQGCRRVNDVSETGDAGYAHGETYGHTQKKKHQEEDGSDDAYG
jgi:hypothetical protein